MGLPLAHTATDPVHSDDADPAFTCGLSENAADGISCALQSSQGDVDMRRDGAAQSAGLRRPHKHTAACDRWALVRATRRHWQHGRGRWADLR